MLNDILRDMYASHSFLNRRHVISKMLAIIILFLSLFFVRSFLSLFFYLLVMVFLIFLSNIPLSTYLRLLWQWKWFYIVLYVIYLLCGINPLNSVIMVLRIVFFVTLIFIFVMTTSYRELLYGLESILKPLERFYLNTRSIAFTVFLGLQLIPMFSDELYREKQLMKSRGGFSNHTHMIRQYKLLFKNAFHKMIFKMDQLFYMMETRFYAPNAHHTYYQKIQFTYYDGLFLFAILCVFILVVLKETIL